MRHGQAELRPGSDAKRRLTVSGEQDVIASAGKIVDRERPKSIVSSPYTRAQQTAQLVRDVWHWEIFIDTWDEITPTGNCALVRDKLVGIASQDIMLVTHQPFISTFIRYLTGKEIPMATAMIASIDIEVIAEEGGELEWVEHGARDYTADYQGIERKRYTSGVFDPHFFTTCVSSCRS